MFISCEWEQDQRAEERRSGRRTLVLGDGLDSYAPHALFEARGATTVYWRSAEGDHLLLVPWNAGRDSRQLPSQVGRLGDPVLAAVDRISTLG